jgi:hypothetical protein
MTEITQERIESINAVNEELDTRTATVAKHFLSLDPGTYSKIETNAPFVDRMGSIKKAHTALKRLMRKHPHHLTPPLSERQERKLMESFQTIIDAQEALTTHLSEYESMIAGQADP